MAPRSSWPFAALTVDGRDRLYAITLFSGKAGPVGGFHLGSQQVVDIAIPLNQ